MNKKVVKRGLFPYLFLAVFLFCMYLLVGTMNTKVNELTYGEFMEAVENKEVKEYVNKLLDNNAEHDKRFAYNLLGATGICLVPLTSFFTNLLGFRITLLEKDVEKFEKNIKTIAQKIVEYVESTK